MARDTSDGDIDRENQSIGELADDNLAALTVLEERLDDLDRGREPTERQLERAREVLERAQYNSVEIVKRFEEQVGPI